MRGQLIKRRLHDTCLVAVVSRRLVPVLLDSCSHRIKLRERIVRKRFYPEAQPLSVQTIFLKMHFSTTTGNLGVLGDGEQMCGDV